MRVKAEWKCYEASHADEEEFEELLDIFMATQGFNLCASGKNMRTNVRDVCYEKNE